MSSEVYLGELDCRRIEALTYAVEQLTAALVESQNTSTNSVSPKLSAAVCRKCTGDQFRCDGCVMGSNFNPPRSTSGE
jgi:hypothetical protein